MFANTLTQLIQDLGGTRIGLAVVDTYAAGHVLQDFERASGSLAL